MSGSLTISSIVTALGIPIFFAAASASSSVLAAIEWTIPFAARIARTWTSPIKPKPITPAFTTFVEESVRDSRENVVVMKSSF